MSRLLSALWLISVFSAGVLSSAPVPVQGSGEVLVDRLVAVVDDDPILLSDIGRVVDLGLIEKIEGESESQLERRVLDGLIDQRLRLHEIERHNFAPLPPAEIDRQLERLRADMASEHELPRRLAELGLDERGLRLLVARQLRVLVYVEQRLGPRIFVEREAVRAYYDDMLTAEMADQGLDPPALDEVRDQIQDLLHEQQLNEEIEAWTEELRLEADVADYLHRSEIELPPIIQRIEE